MSLLGLLSAKKYHRRSMDLLCVAAKYRFSPPRKKLTLNCDEQFTTCIRYPQKKQRKKLSDLFVEHFHDRQLFDSDVQATLQSVLGAEEIDVLLGTMKICTSRDLFSHATR